MMSRLQRKEEPVDLACRHLEEYLETKVRAGDRKVERTNHEYSRTALATRLQGTSKGERRARGASGWI